MNPLFAPVTRALDALLAAAEPYHGLFPSLLNRHTRVILAALPPAIPGQRNGDRSHLGCNLMHDESTLKTLYALSAALDRPDYADAASFFILHRLLGFKRWERDVLHRKILLFVFNQQQ